MRRINEEDLAFIREHATSMTAAQIAGRLGFGTQTIYRHAREMGIELKRANKGQRYSDTPKPVPSGAKSQEARPDGPPDMVRVTNKDCAKCIYGGKQVSQSGCNWYLDTGIRRGCPVGWCNHFTPGTRRGMGMPPLPDKLGIRGKPREGQSNAEERGNI